MGCVGVVDIENANKRQLWTINAMNIMNHPSG